MVDRGTPLDRLRTLAEESRLFKLAHDSVMAFFGTDGLPTFVELFHGAQASGGLQVALLADNGLLVDFVFHSEDQFEFNVFDVDRWSGFCYTGQEREEATEMSPGRPRARTLYTSGGVDWYLEAGDEISIESLHRFHRKLTLLWMQRVRAREADNRGGSV